MEGIQDFTQVNVERNLTGPKKKGILSGIKGKIEEVKKNYWRPQ